MTRLNASARKVSIFLTVDSESITKYFNSNDPAPLYCRQLSHEFQEYLNASIVTTRRYTVIDYKIFCGELSSMKFMVEPLMQTIRRHFLIKKQIKKAEFRKFKRRNYSLLLISVLIVMFCQGVLPNMFNQNHRIHSMFSNTIDVFSWVILWKPIERLIFYWNPFLKEILLFDKMANAEANVIENEEELINYHMGHFDAA
jgi:hypothetical protein